MRDATSKQITQTLANMTAEVRENGISEAASDMWLHALTMYLKAKGLPALPPLTGFDELPSLLRRQAD